MGAMIHGRTDGAFLSEERFAPILAALEELRVPLYLHPAPPPRATAATDYEPGLDPVVATRLAAAGWGWHTETGIHLLHLILGGCFDRHPELQVIVGHLGEMVPWFLDRADEALPPRATGLQRTISEYVRANVWITPSGMFSAAQLRFCVDTVGANRILHSVDYPFIGNEGAEAFLTGSVLPVEAQQAIAHGNAERLLGL